MHHFKNEDPDPSFKIHGDTDPAFHFNADPDTPPHRRDASLRLPVYRLSTAPFLCLHASIVSIRGPLWLNF
jgi:hypothetical protein